MPFCPVCKNEYREGFTECHECKVPLVASLEEIEEVKPKKFFDVNDERSYDFLDQYKEEEKEEESIIVSYGDLNFKEKQFEPKDDDLDVMPSMSDERLRQRQISEAIRKHTSYVNKVEKINDYKSSGVVLLLVGGLGIVALILLYLGIIPGFAGLKSNYIFMIVMFIMFVIFIVGGIVSILQIKTIILEAESDDNMIQKVTAYMNENITVELLAKSIIADKSDTDEELYFKRTEYMNRLLLEQFPEMDLALREKLIDDKYGELYEDNNH